MPLNEKGSDSAIESEPLESNLAGNRNRNRGQTGRDVPLYS
jgi:hypothetical protein